MHAKAVLFAALMGLASSANVDITREECSGPECEAHLLNLPLAANSTVGLPASALYLTGVNNIGGAKIDLQKIQCEFATPSEVGLLTNKAPAYLNENSVTVKWISCDYNRVTPGKQ